MTTEELKLVIRTVLDESGIRQAENSINRLGNTTKKAMGRGVTADATEGFEELRDSIDKIRHLQFGQMFVKNLDQIKLHLAGVKDHTNLAIGHIKSSFENFKGFKQFARQARETGLVYQREFANILKGNAFDKLKAALTSTKEGFKEFGRAGKAALDAIHIKLIALVGAFVGLGVAIKNAFSTASQIKALNNEAAKVGMSINAYQEWSYIMEKTGADAGVLGDAIKTLSAEQMEVRKGTEDSIERFEALGFSMQEVANMSQEQLFKETIKRLQQVRNEVDRTALAYQIFGEEDAAQLANVLRLTNSETASLAATNKALGASISQDLLVKSQALASAVSTMKTAWQGLTNTLGQLFMPVLTVIVNGLTKAIIVVNTFLKTIFGLDMTPAMSNISSATGSAVVGLEGMEEGAEAATGAIAKLKRATMGFDELNIVTNPNAASGGAAAGGGIDLGPDDSGVTQTESALDKVKGKWEEFAQKVQAFMDKWKPQLQAIAGLLGAFTIASLLTSLANAIGLTGTLKNAILGLKNLLGAAITIALQYTLVNNFMDNFIDGQGIMNYIMGLLVAGLGTWVLYSFLGPAGIVIGLGVTAAASIKAVIDNGGIDSVESAVVALTGLAAAIGSVVAAVKVFSLGKVIADIGAFIALVKAGNGLIPTLAATFPKLANAVTGAGKTFTAFGGTIKTVFASIGKIISNAFTSITGGLSAFWKGITAFLSGGWKTLSAGITGALASAKAGILTALTAIKTAISSAISFIIANPIALIIAAIVALVVLIATKGDEIQKALNKVSTWLKNIFCRDWTQVFGPTLGGIMNGFVKIVGDIMGSVKQVLNGIIDFIRGVFTGDWKRAWNGIKDIFAGVFNGLKAVAKAPINGIITLINGALSALTSGFNWVKRQLNKLSIDIPDWVPGVGGETFGFNLSMSTAPQIPLLAAGGITTGPTLAGIGERGREAVLPLDNNTQWMDRLADRLAARTSAPTKVVLKVGERELGYAVIDAINQNTRQTGGLQLQLV